MLKNRSWLRNLIGNKFLSVLLPALLIGAVSTLLYVWTKVEGQSETQTKSSVTTSSKPRICIGCAAQSERSIYIPLTDIPEAGGRQIVFNSRSPHPIEVTPVFYTLDGTSITGAPMTVNPSEIRYLNLKALIPSEHRRRRDWGGLSLNYFGANREIWAQFRFLGINGGNNVDEFFVVTEEQRSAAQAAAWWTPPGSTSVIALGNITDGETSAVVRFANGDGENITLAPHATQLIRRPRSNQSGPNAESVLITTTGAAGSIVPTGLIEAANHNSNSVIRFYDPSLAKQPNLYANGLELKNATTHLILNNTSPTAVVAIPKFIPKAGLSANPVSLSPVSLEPFQTVEVDLDTLIAAVNNRKDLETVSVEVDNNGVAGSLIGALYTIEKGTNLSSEIPLRDSGPARTMTGAYPWRNDEDYSTIVYLTNISDKPAEFAGQVNFAGGKLVLKPRRIAAGETAEIDLRKLRDEQQTDDLGEKIPAGVKLGQFSWAVYGTTGGRVALIGRAVMKSRSNRVVTSYSCSQHCPPNYGFWLDPTGISLLVGDSGTFSAWGMMYYDNGYTQGPYGAGAQWSMAPNDYASLDDVTFTGIAPGTAYADAFFGTFDQWTWDGLDCYWDGQVDYSSGGTIDVNPAFRGSIQAQGPDISYPRTPRTDLGDGVFGSADTVSKAWADRIPLTANEGIDYVNTVQSKLTQTQQNNRIQAFARAIDFINRCRAGGGCTPPGISIPGINGTRVDVVINAGNNFVPSTTARPQPVQ